MIWLTPSIGSPDGVDTHSIIEQAQSEDNYGNRVRKIKELLFSQIGIEFKDYFFCITTLRGARPGVPAISFSVISGRCRMTDSSTRARLACRYRFSIDNEGRGPCDDRINWKGCGVAQMKFRAPSSGIPSFLHLQALNELGTFVRLEHILTGDRLGGYVTRLSPQERVEASTFLENQHSQLRQRIIGYLEGAYGIAKPEPKSLSETLKLEGREHFETLDLLRIDAAVGANPTRFVSTLAPSGAKPSVPDIRNLNRRRGSCSVLKRF